MNNYNSREFVCMYVPWYCLNKAFRKAIKCNGDLHGLILCVRIAVPQQHRLIMAAYVIVRYRYSRRSIHGVDQSAGAVPHGAVVYPHLLSTEDRHAVAVRYASPPVVTWGVPHHSIPPRPAAIYADPVNDDVAYALHSEARPAVTDADVGSSAVYGLERVHHHLLPRPDSHVMGEHYPQRFVLNDGMT